MSEFFEYQIFSIFDRNKICEKFFHKQFPEEKMVHFSFCSEDK